MGHGADDVCELTSPADHVPGLSSGMVNSRKKRDSRPGGGRAVAQM